MKVIDPNKITAEILQDAFIISTESTKEGPKVIIFGFKLFHNFKSIVVLNY